MSIEDFQLSPLSKMLIVAIGQNDVLESEEKITVNPVIAEVATWYEKLRNAMAYKEEEVILRAAIERILNRRLLLGGSGETIARPLVRELVWARYFPDSSVPEALVAQVERCIDLHLQLQDKVIQRHNFNRSTLYEWILELVSADIESILSAKSDKEIISNFMFQFFKDQVSIIDDSQETKEAQVFIAVRRAFGKEDLAFLRYHLFIQFFGVLNEKNIDKISQTFPKIVQKIDYQLRYPLKDRVYSYVKNQTAPFFILEDLLKKFKGDFARLTHNPETLDAAIVDACSNRYKDILSKVQRAIIRSVIFIFVTKVIFALAIEGTFESFLYGEVVWTSLAINTLMSPLLMIIASSFIKTPGKDNSKRVVEMVNQILFEEKPRLNKKLIVALKPKNSRPWMLFIFSVLWIVALCLGLWGINFVLTLLHFNLVSKFIFVFFLMIVSFLSYRINQTARIYTVKQEKDNIFSIIFDFFFMPFIQLGKQLTIGMSQINIILFIFDFIIETPFKSIFAFFEHWFLYLKTQRESLD